MTQRRKRLNSLLGGGLLLGSLLATATLGGAQVAPPGVTATVVLDRTAYRFGVDPIKLAVTVQNVSGAPVLASQGFSQLPLALLLTFTGPDGRPIVATQRTLGTGSNAGFPPVAFVGDQTVLLDPVETLAHDYVRSATVADARTLYQLPQPGFYTVRVGVPIRTYAAIYQTIAGVDHAQLETATFAGAIGAGALTFALFTDADGDGVTWPVPDPAAPGQTAADCNDADPAVFPGNPEILDGKDNDCDPATTEDATPPVTTAAAAPPPNANGWNQTDVTVTLTATDAGSGVQSISYALTGASSGSAVVAGATATILITAEGDTTLTYFARDHAGNMEASKTLLVRLDKTPPPAPSMPDLTAASDSGTSNTDNVTNDNTPTFTGTAEANATVMLFEGTTVLGATTASGTGAWTVTTGVLLDGVHPIMAKARDQADNDSVASVALNLMIDTVAPTAPTVDLPAFVNLANQAAAPLTVTGEAHATVSYTISDADAATPNVTGSGTIPGTDPLTATVNLSGLSDGALTASATLTDAAGNAGATGTDTATKDTVAPAAPVVDLVDASDSGASPTDNVTNDHTPTFSGTAEPTATVTLFDGPAALGTVPAGSTGAWTFTTGLMADGVHSIMAKARDGTGNDSLASAVLNVTIDTVAPPAPSAPDLAASSDTGPSSTDNITVDDTPTLEGTQGADATALTLALLEGTTVLGQTAVAAAGGPWSVTTGTLGDGAHSFTARTTDLAGNTSTLSAGLTATIITVQGFQASVTGQISGYLASGQIHNQGTANSLLSSVDNAKRALDQSNASSAKGILGALVNKLNAFVNGGHITAAVRDALRPQIETLLFSL